MLLSGPPGVGKTLTAESVAEEMRAPLYTISAGDLGTEPQGVEAALGNILEMNTKWNAVLLLDEADVFLEARSAHDLERNKMVSIFLRLLEVCRPAFALLRLLFFATFSDLSAWLIPVFFCSTMRAFSS